MRVFGVADGPLYIFQTQGAVLLSWNCFRKNSSEHRDPAALVLIDVVFVANYSRFSSFAVAQNRQQVAHGGGGHEESSLFSKELSHPQLKFLDPWIILGVIDHDGGVMDYLAHFWSGAGGGVTSEVAEAGRRFALH